MSCVHVMNYIFEQGKWQLIQTERKVHVVLGAEEGTV